MSLSRNIAKEIVKKDIDVKIVTSVLLKYNLLSLLPSILKDVKHIYGKVNTYDTLAIESPFKINKKALIAVQKIVGKEASNATKTISINKNLLAGFKARFQGKLYDASAERVIKHLLMSKAD